MKVGSFSIRRWRRAVTAALAIGLLSSPGWLRQTAQAQEAPAKETPLSVGDDNIDPNQEIKPGFVVNVSVVGEPEPSGTYQVDDAGNVTLKYQGVASAVSIKGLTPKMAEGEIAKFLKTYIKNPQVTVKITAIPRPTVFIGGAVKLTGPLIIAQDTTLVDVLSKVQWLENADLTQVRITRKEKVNGEEKLTTQIVNFDDYIRIRPGVTVNEVNNPVLKDKDRIFVGFKTSQGSGVVSIGGEVVKPAQNIPLRSTPAMTVREVVNMVGGTTPQANRKVISIRRPTLDRPLIIDLDKADQGDLVNNLELRPDDVIYVERLENNAYINVNGGFVKVGKYVYDKRTTLTQAVMEAGGIAPFSKLMDGKIFRHPDNDPKNTQVIAFNWKNIQNGKAADIELLPGDSVWITPGQPSTRPPLDLQSALGILSQGVYLYNQISGRFFLGGNVGF